MPQLTQEESRVLAGHIVDALMAKLSDEEVVQNLALVWGKQVDRWIGGGVRRLALYVLVAVVVTGAIKFHIWDWMLK